MHLTSSPVDWYAARAGGVVAYILLTVVVLLGLTMSGRQRLDRWPRFALEDVHRFGGLLVGTFLVIHVGTIAIDSYLPSRSTSLACRSSRATGRSGRRSASWPPSCCAALAITNHYRDRIDRRFWRRAHYLNFAVWGAATAHGIGSGTDRMRHGSSQSSRSRSRVSVERPQPVCSAADRFPRAGGAARSSWRRSHPSSWSGWCSGRSTRRRVHGTPRRSAIS